MNTIKVHELGLLNAFEHRLRELEWEIRDRFFDVNIEMRRVNRIVRKNIRFLQYVDPIFLEYKRISRRLRGIRLIY